MRYPKGKKRFDSLIIDEGADFQPTCWIALEALGAAKFSWYCFYDRNQAIFAPHQDWSPPFAGIPICLEANLRNTRPIGEFAARLGQVPPPSKYGVEAGTAPFVEASADFTEMAVQLRRRLRTLIHHDGLHPEQITVLAPYRHTNVKSGWAAGLDEVQIAPDSADPQGGKVRVGTIQGFKGLESDVVILAGIDGPAARKADTLYVGCSRAKAALFVLAIGGLPG